MRRLAILAGLAILAVGFQAAWAGEMVIKYKGVRTGVFMGKHAMFLLGAQTAGDGNVDIAMPYIGLHPNLTLMKAVYAANQGDYLRVVTTGAGTKMAAVRIKSYAVQPGEEDPDVYLFAGKGQVKNGKEVVQTVTVTKFGQTFRMELPAKTDSGPGAEMGKVIDAAAVGTPLEIVSDKSGDNYKVKTLKLYDLPKEFVFVKVTFDKGTNVVEVKDGDKAREMTISPKAANAAILSGRISGFRAGDPVLVRSTSDDKGTWLLDIKFAPKDEKPKEATSKEAKKPTPDGR